MSDLKKLRRRFPVFFVSLIGGDYHLLLKSGPAVVRKHFLAAVFLIVVLLVSALSVFYATDLLFHFWQAEVVLSLVITSLFLCIYIFLITTFSKFTKQESVFSASNIVRIGFVAFMAFLISKPIEVLVFSRSLDKKVLEYKNQLHTSYEQKLEALIREEKSILNKEIAELNGRISLYKNKTDEMYLAELILRLDNLNTNIQENLALADLRIANSDFLLYRIQQVVHQPIAWTIYLAITLLFFLPGYLIYSIPASDAYYRLKDEAEEKLITDEYNRFVLQYKKIFKGNWGLTVEIFSRYEDPPFNTRRKREDERLSQQDFINRYLKSNEF